MKWFIRIFFRTVRLITGPLILLIDFITSPRGVKRSDTEQEKIDQQTRNLVLYQFKTCPFCIKVRRHNKRLSLNVEMRDAQHNQEYRQELLQGGGQIKVPCLKIIDEQNNVKWMYESDDIVSYLDKRFAA